MPTLYINNFRGFKSTFLSLKEVNFFVGENSTGKTSILKLISIISSPEFWRYNEFKNREVNLGNFSEIMSSAEHEGFFEIGILSEASERIRGISAIKFRFIESDNQPSLKEIWLLDNYQNIQASIEGKYLKYRFDGDNGNYSDQEKRESFFKSWVTKNNLKHKPFFHDKIEFFNILSIVRHLKSSVTTKLSLRKKKALLAVDSTAPKLLENVAWFEPVRTEPQSVYDGYQNLFQSQGRHAPYILKGIIHNKDVKKILKKFGSDSGLFEDVHIQELRDRSDEKSHRNLPFKILINLDGQSRNITDVGYGVSQVLPLLTEIIARPDNTWFAIQQPEVHLHPRAQAAFADFVFKSFEMDNQRFIIETHSDYLIDRFRLRIHRALKEKSKSDVNSQIVFFSRDKNGNRMDLIEIQKNGSYPDEQPKNFRDFFIKEQFKLIRI